MTTEQTDNPGIFVLIPAHNEEDSLPATLASLASQTVPIKSILVVADNCTDATVAVAEAAGAVTIATVHNTHLKAGALNQGLDYLLPLVKPGDFVLIMDADSHLTHRFIETALSELEADPTLGAVCALFAGEPGRPGLIHSVQRAEYKRFSRSITHRRSKAQVLSGVATVFPLDTLQNIKAARIDGRLPAAPGIYEVTAATEDIELTYAVRKLGYKPIAPEGCVVYTDTMNTWLALARQRIRWQRGMLDALRLYGLNRMTLPYVIRLAGMYLGSLTAPLYCAIVLATYLVAGHIVYHPLWLSIIPFFCFERWWTIRHLGKKDALLAVLLVPEWLYDNYRSVVYWIALFRWFRRTERVWIPT